VGFLRDLIYGPEPGPIIGRSMAGPAVTPHGALEDAIAEQIAFRTAEFSLADALQMPAVIRGVQLICSLIAQFEPRAYRGGVPLDEQPALLTQPAPFGSRYQFYYQTVYSQLAMDGSARTGGDAYWWIAERDDLGTPRQLVVLDPAEVAIEWDAKRFMPVYHWRGKPMNAGDVRNESTNLVHLTIGRDPGELHGRSPLIAGLEALAVVDAAERYAMGYFYTGGVPSVAILAKGKGSPEEAARLKAQYMAAHAGPEPTPAVFFQGNTGDLQLEYPPTDAQKAQLQESRAYGATITARLLGIPAALLHVETSGATITYVNSGGVLDEFVRTTAMPVYLAPLEGYLSAMVPRTQRVRFDTAELYRIDVAGRVNVYAAAIGAGIMQPAEARVLEGWPVDGPIESNPALGATPPVTGLQSEVPVNA
jgi:HK97 family phage portal protein